MIAGAARLTCSSDSGLRVPEKRLQGLWRACSRLERGLAVDCMTRRNPPFSTLWRIPTPNSSPPPIGGGGKRRQ